MQCLVTGGAGFIGSHLVEELLNEGHQVRILDNLLTGKKQNLALFEKNKSFEWINGSVENQEHVNSATKGVDVVFHHAARVSVPESIQKPMDYHQTNVNGTMRVLEAAKINGVKKVINVSSSAVYGDTQIFPISEKSPIQPMSMYAITKHVQENLCKYYSDNYGIETVSFRYFNVYGPRQDPTSAYAAAIPKFFLKIEEKKVPVIFGDGKQTRDFVYVKDVVSANIRAMKTSGLRGEVFNIAGGSRISIIDVAKKIMGLTGFKGEPEFQSKRAGDIVHSYADITSAKSALEWQPKWSLDQGLEQTLKWFQTDYNKN